ncbi:MAG TPA: lipid-A-disaccharide synthase, partial [Ohtaekwangia sp.]|nr:lipid-A-disaccharide synthase [Ohtaekwangia sp.]
PFEKEFFKKFHWESDYVGNPVLDAIKAHHVASGFLEQYRFDPVKPLVALLPGSRKQELKYIIPLMTAIVQRFPDYQFGLAAISNLDPAFYGELARHPQVKVIQEDTYNLLAHATAAVVTSGTATLETALCKVPQVVVYKANPASYWIAKWLVKVPYISLVNLIAGREVVKEMIQEKANANSVGIELKRLVADEEYRRIIQNGYEEITAILDTGGSASENAARLMTNYLTADPFPIT